MEYVGAVYRPPSEARSLIVQLTLGCAHNTCTFCTMYKGKRFQIRPMKDIMDDFREMSEAYGPRIRRIFLADGDALVMKTDDLLEVLAFCWGKGKFPNLERVTSYGTTQDILRKTSDELRSLKDAGLDMVYLGIESGDDEVLKNIHKGVTKAQIIEAGKKLKDAGIKCSVTLISGVGGKERLKEHALESADIITQIKPEYVGFLTLLLEPGAAMIEDVESGKLTLLEPEDVVEEMKLFLSNVDSDGTVFRSNHASNYVSLKGDLNKDIPHMLSQLEDAAQDARYKYEGFRAL